MKDVLVDEEKESIKKLSKKYCKSEMYVLLLFKICESLNLKNSKEEVEKYISSVSKGVSKLNI